MFHFLDGWWNFVVIVLALTGALVWAGAIFIVVFYWLCGIPYKNKGEKNV